MYKDSFDYVEVWIINRKLKRIFLMELSTSGWQIKTIF